ncbi:hypothetical protein WSK_3582 [Novosphingobium sp. Rr 2-17]|uniref:ferritin-like domain-containing protein n=1 Tax=Novosphingobium sp. Rr 2-17 TaxID=555793 RepID=UPI000269A873|nr:ferritin-like protein [Novosphingobium sp. Rr 2-17]EIZ77911.1 hypothetical protein WSK_3582 [Novosphingobium sp. Rr 2-17]
MPDTIQLPSTVITDIDQLQAYLQVALQLEHATLPPYLTTAYSARIEANKPAIDIIRAVGKEEMLHLTLAANLLNAVGGQPNLNAPDFVPKFPAHLPTGQNDFRVGLERLSEHAIDIFLAIERPTPPETASVVQYITRTVPIAARHVDPALLKDNDPMVPITPDGENYLLHYQIATVAHADLSDRRRETSEAGVSLLPHVMAQDGPAPITLHYWSIGEFYKAIHLGFVELCHTLGEKALFTGAKKRQVGSTAYFSGGGQSMEVTGLRSALAAIDLIAGQGEGNNSSVYDKEGEIAHYYRFDQIKKRRYYRNPDEHGGDRAGDPQGGRLAVDMDQVYPIRANAKLADYAGHPELERRALLFNGQYRRFLARLTRAFNGEPELLDAKFYLEMFNIKDAMQALIRNPIPGTAENAAPTFEMDKFIDEDETSEATHGMESTTEDRLENFLQLSVQLCGITHFDLTGTGYGKDYFATVEEIVGTPLMQRLLDAFVGLPPTPAPASFQAAILNHPEFGPVARNIIKLWYTATWFQLPTTWRDNFGARARDQSHVPYPYAYAKSLLGPAVGAHPAGAKPSGHQSWALPPMPLPVPEECL